MVTTMPSTVISQYSYDPAKQVLRVVFVSGLIYNYKNVPQEVYNEMKMSISKGTYLNKHIKGIYPFEKGSKP
jgi:KTSC domain-containing protein